VHANPRPLRQETNAHVLSQACVQELLPAKAAIDVPLALALIGLGFVIVVAPSLACSVRLARTRLGGPWPAPIAHHPAQVADRVEQVP
jgi:hypothetical protein